MPKRKNPEPGLRKLATGFPGFDEMTGGGLPLGRVTVISGGPGTGKTLFSMQTAVHCVSASNHSAIYVSFEEHPDNLVANVAGFGWDMDSLVNQKLWLVDGRPKADALQSGQYDIGGLLAVLEAMARKHNTGFLVLDGFDGLLAMLEGSDQRRELARLHAWIESLQLTTCVTLKTPGTLDASGSFENIASYLADCVIMLERSTVNAVSSRSVQIGKYRGSTHRQNPVPYVIGRRGIEIQSVDPRSEGVPIFKDRLSTGVASLDSMLDGGHLRGSTTLLSGSPGTSKTTLAAKFAEAASARGEQSLYVCFDEAPEEIVRNLTSVGIDLAPHVASGRLEMAGFVAKSSSADQLASGVLDSIERTSPKVLVLDPVSAFTLSGNEDLAQNAVRMIVQHCKRNGITMLLTSLLDNNASNLELSKAHVSTMCDNWIHLSYVASCGERNRALTIIKSRGTGHSNQVRELMLSDEGIGLREVYTEEGEVLMGAMRWQREERGRRERRQQTVERTRRQRAVALEVEELAARLRQVDEELRARRDELEQLSAEAQQNTQEENLRRDTLDTLRDPAPRRSGTRRRKK
jgi:circadian clock protein KaiC